LFLIYQIINFVKSGIEKLLQNLQDVKTTVDNKHNELGIKNKITQPAKDSFYHLKDSDNLDSVVPKYEETWKTLKYTFLILSFSSLRVNNLFLQ
jgi:hypothetical protein